MIKLLLAKENETSNNGVWLHLPAASKLLGEADRMLQRTNDRLHIIEVDSSIPNIKKYIKDGDNLKELDFLAQRIIGFTEQEAILFYGALDIEAVGGLKDIINLTYNLNNYELYQGVSSKTELGRYLVDNDIVHIHDSAIPYIDFSRVATEYDAEYSSTYTANGYVVKTGCDAKCLYDGITLPDIYAGKNYIFNLKLISQYSFDTMEDTYTLKLPATEAALHEAREQLMVKHFDECEIEDCDCPIESLSNMLPMDGDIHSLNRLAQIVKDISQNEAMITKLLAALEAENPKETSAVLEIAESLDRYELMLSSVISATDYAHYVLFESGRYDIYIDDEIKSFVDYEKYGNYKMKEDGVMQTSFGVIRRIDEPFQEHEVGFTQQMGGM